jgi:hypothetical protein
MIGLIVRHPPIVVILEVDCSAEDGPIPRHHFLQAARLEGDMVQRGFDDRHCWPPKTFSTLEIGVGDHLLINPVCCRTVTNSSGSQPPNRNA